MTSVADVTEQNGIEVEALTRVYKKGPRAVDGIASADARAGGAGIIELAGGRRSLRRRAGTSGVAIRFSQRGRVADDGGCAARGL